MAAAARQLAPRDRWLPIDRVAELTGTTISAWRHKAVALQGRGLAAQLPPPSGRGKPVWWFDPKCDRRLSYLAGESRDDREVRVLSGKYPAHLAERAAQKLRHLRAYWQACRHTDKRTAARRTVEQARQAEGEAVRISVRTIQIWERAYRNGGVDALVDRYGQPERTRDTTRSPGAVQFFYALYHTTQGMTLRTCHDVTLREAQRRGWKWANSEEATRAWLTAHDDRELTILLREGSAAYQHRAMPYIEQDYSKLAPGELYVCDHHQLKAFGLHNNKVIRPWLTAVLDARTRILVGWHLGPSPHSDAILQSLRMAFCEWGVPKIVKIDNGRDYTAKVFSGLTKRQVRRLRSEFGSDWKERLRKERDRTDCDQAWFGLLPELGCEIVYALPYQPWSKVIERWFRTFSDQHTRTLAAFCDTSAERKPEGLATIVADVHRLPSIEDQALAIGEYLTIYHAAPSFADGMEGRSPRQVWADVPGVARTGQADQLDLLMNIVGAVKVGANGVTVTVGGTRLSYGQYSSKLRAMMGRQVLVSLDRNDLSEAVILTADRDRRRVICRAPRNDRLSPAADATSDEMREAQASVNRARKQYRKAKASAPQRSRTAAEMVAIDRARRARQLRATGTDGKPPAHPDDTIKVVQTGIDAASIPPRTPIEAPSKPADYDLGDLVTGRCFDADDGGGGENDDLAALVGGGQHFDEQDTEVFDLADLVTGERQEDAGGDETIEDAL